MMRRKILTPVFFVMIALIVIFFGSKFFHAKKNRTSLNAAQAMANLPVTFIENQGQIDSAYPFYAQGPGFQFSVSEGGMVYSFSRKDGDKSQRESLKMNFVGANTDVKVLGSKLAQGKVNYLIGNQKDWKTNLQTYHEITYKEIYPGIDYVVNGEIGSLKSEFRVKPGSDYKKILLAYSGIDALKLSDAGDLIIQSQSVELRETKPFIYQEIDGKQLKVDGKYQIQDKQVSFEISRFDPEKELVIDPALVYSTYLGGYSYDEGLAITVDALGNCYITGEVYSNDFPITMGAFQTTHGGGAYDAFVTKLAPDGSLIFSTYLGGSSDDYGLNIVVGASENVIVIGNTASTNFPTTVGAFQTTHGGSTDAFVTKLAADGSLIFSTYLGGESLDYGYHLALDLLNRVYVAGNTWSSDFPSTVDSFQPNFGGVMDGFLVKLAEDGSLIFSTYLGGDDNEKISHMVIDSFGNSFLTGYTYSANFPVANAAYDIINWSGLTCEDVPGDPYDGCEYEYNPDAFITKFAGDGSAVFSTYLGGEQSDAAVHLGVDTLGSVFVTGYTDSSDFPLLNAAYDFQNGTPCEDIPGDPYDGCSSNTDAFVTKFTDEGSILFSTYLGGDGVDQSSQLAVDFSGNVVVTGVTYSDNFPTTASAFQTTYGGGSDDAFVTKFTNEGVPVFSTYLGGESTESSQNLIGIDASGNIFVIGSTFSSDFPLVSPLQGTYNGLGDFFITKLAPDGGMDFSSYFGGSGDDYFDGDGFNTEMSVGAEGVIYFTGETHSCDFPVAEAAQETCGGVGEDGFVVKICFGVACPEICNGLDDDGDGLVDEDFSDSDGDGIADCMDVEGCDGLDNDGDGAVDEGFPDTDGDGIADCMDEELCDGIDNNSNGATDEGGCFDLSFNLRTSILTESENLTIHYTVSNLSPELQYVNIIFLYWEFGEPLPILHPTDVGPVAVAAGGTTNGLASLELAGYVDPWTLNLVIGVLYNNDDEILGTTWIDYYWNPFIVLP